MSDELLAAAHPTRVALPRRLAAELLGTMLLVAAVVGSGIMGLRLSSADVGLQLLESSIATMLALTVLILIFGPVSGAHLNPVVSIADWWLHRRTRGGLSARELTGYVLAQSVGAICGAVLANVMFNLDPVTLSRTTRAAPNLWLGEVVATAGLVLLIVALVRTRRATLVAPAVGAYIGAAYWFTSSTSFANPAVTIGRAFTDTFAGIAPASVPGFVAAQLVGACAGVGLLLVLYPDRSFEPMSTGVRDQVWTDELRREPDETTRTVAMSQAVPAHLSEDASSAGRSLLAKLRPGRSR